VGDTYPRPTSAAASAVMRGNRKRDTGPELRLRRALHALKLRYRVNRAVDVGVERPVRPDIVFGPAKVAVFVHGCFWHACPEHGTQPGGLNASYWAEKLRRNVERDADQVDRLTAIGWLPVIVWEHEDPARAATQIASLVKRRRSGTKVEGLSDTPGAGCRGRQAGGTTDSR
jgi:DNA mismatch endonuclease, patch repair protein